MRSASREHKITVFGAGAMGTLYGARLARAGHDVAVVARGARRETVAKVGLRIRRRGSAEIETARVAVLERPEERPADVIVVLVRRQQVESVLAALASSKDDVAMMVNVASGYDRWKEALGERVFIGFPGATGTFVDDDVVEYEVAPSIAQPTVLGEPSGAPTARVDAFARALRDAKFPVQTRSDMDAWQRTHAAWITPFMLGAATARDDDARFASRENLGRCFDAMREALALLRARGIPTTPWSIRAFAALPRWLVVTVARTFLLAAPKQRAHLVATGIDSRAEGIVLADEMIAAGGDGAPRAATLESLRDAAR